MRRLITFACVVALFVFVAPIHAQIMGTDRENIFQEDNERVQEAQEKRLEGLLTVDNLPGEELQFNAPTIEFEKSTNELKGSGGVIISRAGTQLQCDTAYYNQDTKDIRVEGQLLYSWPQGRISAEQGDLSLKTETGEFRNSQVVLDDSLFSFKSNTMFKDSETEYRLYDAGFSSCDCKDGGWPWSIDCDEAKIEEEGYAHTYDTTVQLYDIPIFYTPYMFFPVKNERQSGLLPPTYGYSSQDGVQFRQPTFLVLDEHMDLNVSPFIESQTRYGSQFDFRAALSNYHQIETKFIYSDDSKRDGDFRGTNVSGLFDPSFDDERYGIYHKHLWRTESGFDFPTTFVADIHYISDDLFLREFDEEDIGKRSSRYTSSQVLLSTRWHEYLSSELSGEYNQSIETDDDFTFQRLPEGRLTSQKTFRPFGFNPYGVKLVTKGVATATAFDRDVGFDGWRYDLAPEVKVPHHYRNIFSGELSLRYNQTYYELEDDINPASGVAVEENDRGVLTTNYKVGTALERVYNVEDDSFLRYVTSLGSQNQTDRLRRVKHLIEPSVTYTYIPDEEQDANPFFDSLDRIRRRNLVTLGVRTSLVGRFLPKYVGSEDISELTPEVSDLPEVDTQAPLSLSSETPQVEMAPGRIPVRTGSMREIAFLSVRQSYDSIEDRENLDPNRSAWSDINFAVGTFPTKDFGLVFETNVDPNDIDPSSWSVSTHFRDDRGDLLRGRYTFIDNGLSQLDANLEVVLNEQLRIGAYSRFDEASNEFIETDGAFRFRNSCQCWGFDLGVRDTANPDRQQVYFALNFSGLGVITQKFNRDPDEQ